MEGYMPNFSFIALTEVALGASEALASTVLEVENPRSEFWVEIKILLYKLTPENTKMASEFELDDK